MRKWFFLGTALCEWCRAHATWWRNYSKLIPPEDCHYDGETWRNGEDGPEDG